MKLISQFIFSPFFSPSMISFFFPSPFFYFSWISSAKHVSFYLWESRYISIRSLTTCRNSKKQNVSKKSNAKKTNKKFDTKIKETMQVVVISTLDGLYAFCSSFLSFLLLSYLTLFHYVLFYYHFVIVLCFIMCCYLSDFMKI